MKKVIVLLASSAFALWFNVAPQLPQYCVVGPNGGFTKNFVTQQNGKVVDLVDSLGQTGACHVAAYKF